MKTKDGHTMDSHIYKTPEFVYAEFKLGEKAYSLKIVYLSRYRLGMVVTFKDFDLLDRLNAGDTLENMTFYATWTMINVDGTVKFKRKIIDGKYKNHYIIGIESYDIIDSCKPIPYLGVSQPRMRT